MIDNSEEGCRLRTLLAMNRYGRRFVLDPGLAPVGIWATILARASDDDEVQVVYAFLRANNENLVRRPRRDHVRGALGRRVE
jgi:hypothetical protein